MAMKCHSIAMRFVIWILLFTDIESSCRLQNSTFRELSQLINSSTSVYYEHDSVLYPNPCPVDDGQFRVVYLKTFVAVTYRVFINDDKTHTEAVAACNGYGGHLIITPDHTTRKFIKRVLNCPDYSSKGPYYIDGSNLNATDYFDVDQWVFSDGSLVPKKLWTYNDKPTRPESRHCIVMKVWQGCKFVDNKCTDTAAYICEIDTFH